MINEASRIINDLSQVEQVVLWSARASKKILESGPVRLTVERYNPKRSNSQNSKLWPMLDDVSLQVPWGDGGQLLPKEDWKDIFSAAWKQQELVPGIDGGFVVLPTRTSKMSKPEFSVLIEIIYAFGTDKGVKWSEPSLKAYEEYRECKVHY